MCLVTEMRKVTNTHRLTHPGMPWLHFCDGKARLGCWLLATGLKVKVSTELRTLDTPSRQLCFWCASKDPLPFQLPRKQSASSFAYCVSEQAACTLTDLYAYAYMLDWLGENLEQACRLQALPCPEVICKAVSWSPWQHFPSRGDRVAASLTRAYPRVFQGWLFLDSSIHDMSHRFWKGYRVIYHPSRHLKGIFKMPNVCSLSDWVSFCASFPLYLTPWRGLLQKLPLQACRKPGYDTFVLLWDPGWCGWPIYSPSLIYLHLRTDRGRLSRMWLQYDFSEGTWAGSSSK